MSYYEVVARIRRMNGYDLKNLLDVFQDIDIDNLGFNGNKNKLFQVFKKNPSFTYIILTKIFYENYNQSGHAEYYPFINKKFNINLTKKDKDVLFSIISDFLKFNKLYSTRIESNSLLDLIIYHSPIPKIFKSALAEELIELCEYDKKLPEKSFQDILEVFEHSIENDSRSRLKIFIGNRINRDYINYTINEILGFSDEYIESFPDEEYKEMLPKLRHEGRKANLFSRPPYIKFGLNSKNELSLFLEINKLNDNQIALKESIEDIELSNVNSTNTSVESLGSCLSGISKKLKQFSKSKVVTIRLDTGDEKKHYFDLFDESGIGFMAFDENYKLINKKFSNFEIRFRNNHGFIISKEEIKMKNSISDHIENKEYELSKIHYRNKEFFLLSLFNVSNDFYISIGKKSYNIKTNEDFSMTDCNQNRFSFNGQLFNGEKRVVKKVYTKDHAFFLNGEHIDFNSVLKFYICTEKNQFREIKLENNSKISKRKRYLSLNELEDGSDLKERFPGIYKIQLVIKNKNAPDYSRVFFYIKGVENIDIEEDLLFMEGGRIINLKKDKEQFKVADSNMDILPFDFNYRIYNNELFRYTTNYNSLTNLNKVINLSDDDVLELSSNIDFDLFNLDNNDNYIQGCKNISIYPTIGEILRYEINVAGFSKIININNTLKIENFKRTKNEIRFNVPNYKNLKGKILLSGIELNPEKGFINFEHKIEIKENIVFNEFGNDFFKIFNIKLQLDSGFIFDINLPENNNLEPLNNLNNDLIEKEEKIYKHYLIDLNINSLQKDFENNIRLSKIDILKERIMSIRKFIHEEANKSSVLSNDYASNTVKILNMPFTFNSFNLGLHFFDDQVIDIYFKNDLKYDENDVWDFMLSIYETNYYKFHTSPIEIEDTISRIERDFQSTHKDVRISENLIKISKNKIKNSSKGSLENFMSKLFSGYSNTEKEKYQAIFKTIIIIADFIHRGYDSKKMKINLEDGLNLKDLVEVALKNNDLFMVIHKDLAIESTLQKEKINNNQKIIKGE